MQLCVVATAPPIALIGATLWVSWGNETSSMRTTVPAQRRAVRSSFQRKRYDAMHLRGRGKSGVGCWSWSFFFPSLSRGTAKCETCVRQPHASRFLLSGKMGNYAPAMSTVRRPAQQQYCSILPSPTCWLACAGLSILFLSLPHRAIAACCPGGVLQGRFVVLPAGVSCRWNKGKFMLPPSLA